MKISHSLIILTSFIFLAGSMITVGMDIKRTTNDIYANVEIAKLKHFQDKEFYLLNTNKHQESMDSAHINKSSTDIINKQKIALKLKSLNQH